MAAPTSLQEEGAEGGRGVQELVKAGKKTALGALLAEDILELMQKKKKSNPL